MENHYLYFVSRRAKVSQLGINAEAENSAQSLSAEGPKGQAAIVAAPRLVGLSAFRPIIRLESKVLYIIIRTNVMLLLRYIIKIISIPNEKVKKVKTIKTQFTSRTRTERGAFPL